jgi:hypothetical protein
VITEGRFWVASCTAGHSGKGAFTGTHLEGIILFTLVAHSGQILFI